VIRLSIIPNLVLILLASTSDILSGRSMLILPAVSVITLTPDLLIVVISWN